MEQALVRCICLPISVCGFVIDNPAGDHNIFINDRLSHATSRDALAHEMAHIAKNHLYRYDDVDSQERECER